MSIIAPLIIDSWFKFTGESLINARDFPEGNISLLMMVSVS